MAALSQISGGFDSIAFEILEDGTISTKTSGISGTNHVSADELLAGLAELTGGPHTSKQREDVKVPLHHHSHDHKHQHSHAHQ
jgi:hypothetical protein